MAEREKQVFLLIADISGYTRFMLQNAGTLSHAQATITSLMNAVIKEARLPLKIAKLEGDAVFLYAADRGRGTWPADLEAIRRRLGGLYTAFTRKAQELHLANSCHCEACTQVGHLTVKFIAHYGKALFYRLGRFDELAGPDVIILHRLLKNGVPSKEYLLLTEAAYAALGLPTEDPHFAVGREDYQDVGSIGVRVRLDLTELRFVADGRLREVWSSRLSKMRAMAEKMWAMMVTARGRRFRHLDQG